MTKNQIISCPVCSFDVSMAADCHSGCPIGTGCHLIRCSNCGYEFPDPERSTGVKWMKSIFSFFSRQKHRNGVRGLENVIQPLSMVAKGTKSRVISFRSQGEHRLAELANLGVLPGTELTLLQRIPTLVLAVGETTLGLDPELASEIYVEPIPTP